MFWHAADLFKVSDTISGDAIDERINNLDKQFTSDGADLKPLQKV